MRPDLDAAAGGRVAVNGTEQTGHGVAGSGDTELLGPGRQHLGPVAPHGNGHAGHFGGVGGAAGVDHHGDDQGPGAHQSESAHSAGA